MKTCNRCNRSLPLDLFYAMSSAKDGRQSCCIECRKEYNRANAAAIKERHRDYMVRTGRTNPDGARKKQPSGSERIKSKVAPNHKLKKYGITQSDYEFMLISQGYRCLICFTEQEGRRLAVDHDHETGVVRGLLCTRCNLAIGLLGDQPSRMNSAREYLLGRPSGTEGAQRMDGPQAAGFTGGS